jgi:hypothetical protein
MKFEIAPNRAVKQLNLSDAILYCFSLNIDGVTGWRLPTNSELSLIIPHRIPWDWYWFDQNKLSSEEVSNIRKAVLWPSESAISLVYCTYEDGSLPTVSYEAWNVAEENMVIPVRDIQ